MRRPTSKPGCSLSPEPPNGPRLPSNAPCTSPTRHPTSHGWLPAHADGESKPSQTATEHVQEASPTLWNSGEHTRTRASRDNPGQADRRLSAPGQASWDYEKIYHLKNSPPKANEMYGVGVSIERTPESLGSPAGLTVGGVAHPKPFRR